mgnify:CR=1 FL=1
MVRAVRPRLPLRGHSRAPVQRSTTIYAVSGRSGEHPRHGRPAPGIRVPIRGGPHHHRKDDMPKPPTKRQLGDLEAAIAAIATSDSAREHALRGALAALGWSLMRYEGVESVLVELTEPVRYQFVPVDEHGAIRRPN